MLVDERIVKQLYAYHRRANKRTLKAMTFVVHCEGLTSATSPLELRTLYDRVMFALTDVAPPETLKECARIWQHESRLSAVAMLRSLCATYMATILVRGSELNKGPAYTGGRRKTR